MSLYEGDDIPSKSVSPAHRIVLTTLLSASSLRTCKSNTERVRPGCVPNDRTDQRSDLPPKDNPASATAWPSRQEPFCPAPVRRTATGTPEHLRSAEGDPHSSGSARFPYAPPEKMPGEGMLYGARSDASINSGEVNCPRSAIERCPRHSKIAGNRCCCLSTVYKPAGVADLAVGDDPRAAA